MHRSLQMAAILPLLVALLCVCSSGQDIARHYDNDNFHGIFSTDNVPSNFSATYEIFCDGPDGCSCIQLIIDQPNGYVQVFEDGNPLYSGNGGGGTGPPLLTDAVRNVTIAYSQESASDEPFTVIYQSIPAQSSAPVVRHYSNNEFHGEFATRSPVPSGFSASYEIVCDSKEDCSIGLELKQPHGTVHVWDDGKLLYTANGDPSLKPVPLATGPTVRNLTITYVQKRPSMEPFEMRYWSPLATGTPSGHPSLPPVKHTTTPKPKSSILPSLSILAAIVMSIAQIALN